MQWTGKILIFFGLVLVLTGFIFYMGLAKTAFGWLGHLPGDIRIERDNFRFYFPITTGVILSIVLSLILRFFIMYK